MIVAILYAVRGDILRVMSNGPRFVQEDSRRQTLGDEFVQVLNAVLFRPQKRMHCRRGIRFADHHTVATDTVSRADRSTWQRSQI